MTPEQSAAVQKIREALALNPDGQHIYTHWRDSNNWKANEAFVAACAPATIRTILAALDAAQATHVGESAFEAWFAQYNPAGKGDKQRARDAYAAGMADPAAQAPREVPRLTDDGIDKACIDIFGSDHGAILTPSLQRAIGRAIESRVRELCGVAP